jgi:DNA-binding NarL/FixJ family response regulator
MLKIQGAAKPMSKNHLLTCREIEVLKCLAQGMSNREIAQELSISTRTITTHVRNILDKLELDNRTQAALYAVEWGILSSEQC